MNPFQTLTAKVIPLPLKDVDTDMIIPAQYLTSISREGYGENVFRRLRDEDPNFPLNQEKFKDGKVLVARNNFGCGSSREHAAWALLGWGIQVVIAPDFADIFKSNSLKNGLVLITLPEETIEEILKSSESGEYEITVDLEHQKITLPNNQEHKFDFDPFRKHCILNGLDDLSYLKSHESVINSYQEKRQNNIYFSTQEVNNEASSPPLVSIQIQAFSFIDGVEVWWYNNIIAQELTKYQSPQKKKRPKAAPS